MALLSLFAGLAVGLGAVAGWAAGEWAWLAWWGGGSCALAAAAVATTTVWPYGKRPGGRRAWWSTLVMLPVLAPTWLYWHVRRPLLREPPWHRLAPTLWIGRRLLDREFTLAVDHVVDLTCEYAERPRQRRHPGYVCLPLLDGSARRPDVLVQLVRRLVALPGVVYLHCAEGHGRTATMAAAWLLVTGRAASPAAALAQVAAVRPRARPYRGQVVALERFWQRWQRGGAG